jgi:hypothetical protein
MKQRHEHETGKDCIGSAWRLELLNRYRCGDQMKEDGMSEVCSMNGEDLNAKDVS